MVVVLIVISLVIFILYVYKGSRKREPSNQRVVQRPQKASVPIEYRPSPQETHAKSLGNKGELRVAQFLGTLKNGLVINNIILKQNDRYTQIDHIFITDEKIIVIETKNHSGTIKVSNATYWWTLYPNGKWFKLYNPVRQNTVHMEVLSNMLRTRQLDQIVVFPNNDCRFNGKMSCVYQFSDFKERMTKENNSFRKMIDKELTYRLILDMDKSGDPAEVASQIAFAKHSVSYKNHL